MAIDAKFNSIVHDIQLSNLNFTIQLTPYAEYVVIKKSTQLDKNGNPLVPTSPTFMLLQKSYSEHGATLDQLSELQVRLQQCEQRCAELECVNTSLLKKLQNSDSSLVASGERISNLEKILKEKDMENAKLCTARNDLNSKLKLKESEYVGLVRSTDANMNSLDKTIKMKDKNIYDLHKSLDDSRDKITNLKTRSAQVESDNKKLRKKLRRCVGKNETFSISSQTSSNLDITTAENSDGKRFSMTDDDEKCVMCNLGFSSRKELLDHNKEYPLCCRECGVCFATSHDVNQHDLEANHEE